MLFRDLDGEAVLPDLRNGQYQGLKEPTYQVGLNRVGKAREAVLSDVRRRGRFPG